MEASVAYLLKISRWLQRCTGLPPDDADDIVQEAFVRCFAYLHQRYPSETPDRLAGRITSRFICKVAYALWVDRLREQEREQYLRQYAVVHIEPSQSEADWLDYQAAMEVVEHLDPFWQKVLWWRVEGYCWQEIAQWTGKPVGTLASGLERSIDKACADLGCARQKSRPTCKKRCVRTE